ncbi:hypothetical protein KL86DYS1_30349 [uncultured Dysgonomonas sp.]|uniref:Uncharacterized protein n=1 Tax=uncultured Dysgonomonas sp. TaxID=206096 RepID=A0A212JT10_9BACT|nr:hypothetical protein KL86DYS1_30349 [uncultured Dysgonomonas sp.]
MRKWNLIAYAGKGNRKQLRILLLAMYLQKVTKVTLFTVSSKPKCSSQLITYCLKLITC